MRVLVSLVLDLLVAHLVVVLAAVTKAGARVTIFVPEGALAGELTDLASLLLEVGESQRSAE